MSRLNLPEIEEEVHEYWRQKSIFNETVELKKKGKKFYFCQGPPFTSGQAHIGHAWNHALKDMILRFRTMKGFDVELIRGVADAVSIPVIALGGAGKWEDFAVVLREGHAAAVSAANIFHYTEQSVLNAKKYLFGQGLNVRDPKLLEDKYRDKSSVQDPTLAWADKRE